MRFTLALHTDDGVNYGVTVPALPGCFSAGETLDQAIENAREAIDAHVELLMDEDDQPLPLPLPLATHQADPMYAGAVWAVVEVPVEQYFGPEERIDIAVPRRLLQQIDAQARARHLSRSAFLTQIASEAMRRTGTP